MKLNYAVQPVIINQPFGGNAEYYSKFSDQNGKPMKGHMGIDFKASHGQPVYAPCDGMARYVGPDVHGGDGIYITTPDKYDIILWHLCSKDDPKFAPKIPPSGTYPVKQGELIAYADNTGAPYESSGDHLHFGLIPLIGTDYANGFGGCIDPAPFFETPQAEVANGVEQAVQTATQIVEEVKTTPLAPQDKNAILTLLLKVANLLQSFFK